MNKSLKIIIFDGTFKTTAFINRLAEGLSKHHQVYILGFNESLKLPIEGVNYVKLGSNTNKIGFIITSLSLALSQFSTKMLFSTVKHILKFNRKQLQKQNFKRAVDTINPDIIHAQWVSNIPVLESILAQNKYPVVLSQRGYHINVRPFIDSDNFNYLKEWLPKLAGFHSVSKAISKKGNLIYKNPSKIDPVVYSGLDLEEIPFRKKRRGGKPLELISVGRPHWIKGYSYALKSCAILKDKGIDFKYSIVGAGQNEELLYLRALYNLGDQVVLLDSLPQQAVFEAISQADIMLLTSIEEGVANVAIEAMALGTLVISTDCGGMPELIDDHITGFIVPSRSADVMANKIIEIDKTDHTLLEAIAVKAREKVMTQHSTNKMIADMERLYKNVLIKQ